ncbi:MAG: peptidoglycan DD-metalloendopeptidase family protein [Deltaproteobacteria bacterium]|nr:peptidoglycan DD-metalloendopeptidase family protein [Deltaproteobacteria bacterium]
MRVTPQPVVAAGAADRAATRRVAREFESLLLNEVMKSMRRTVPESPLGEGLAGEIFTGMLDETFADALAGGAGLGLADLLAAQLTPENAAPPPAAIARALTDGEWVQPTTTPATPLSAAQRFGAYRPGNRPAACGAGHCGVDLGRPGGTPVVAAASGTVTGVGRDPGSESGLWVELSHENRKLTTRYLHLSHIAPELTPGSSVTAGEVVGEVGATGTTARGDHLHFEVSYRTPDGGRRWLDPAPYLPRWKAR